ncbi:hypothetical protein O181_081036 [Austropuccinia psidii MF-1]|uniref:Uncharacterized protein n=1 Tax=Austropuccinia psidii MF-1 TaxID=1389203 RepID=A0A9Q3FJD0_9BASI|nr:hypothetical protein [Austropuccinia psidii MF-1]
MHFWEEVDQHLFSGPLQVKNGFHLMAMEVNKKSNQILNCRSASIHEQWHLYKKKYITAKKFQNLTLSGITEVEDKKGIHTMAEKLDTTCPCFSKMNSLYGHKPNATKLESYDAQEVELSSNEGEDEPVGANLSSPNDPKEYFYNLFPFN